MVVLSVLRAASQGCRALTTPPLASSLLFSLKSNGTIAIARSMSGHGNKMIIRPSKFEYNKWKDQLHFYTLLGVIPLTLLVTYVNVFIGPAEIAEIPEDYEPKHWEYYKHPISRWIAKNMYYSPEILYENHLHVVSYEMKKRDMRILEKKVKKLMAERGDYQAWYYAPKHSQQIYTAREDYLTTSRQGGNS